MLHDPYAPPMAELSRDSSETPSFYVVSLGKFFIMALGTCGFYGFYWYYRNWSSYKRASGARIYPLVRVFLGIIYNFSLFSLIQQKLKDRGYSPWCPAYMLALVILLLAVSEMLFLWAFGSPFSPGMKYAAMAIQLAVVVHVQRMINRAEGDPKGKSNSRLTGLNYLWIGVGLTLWGLTIYALTVVVLDGELPFGIRW